MRNLPRKKVEEAFVGKLCSAIHPVSLTPEDEFWVYPVRIEEASYQLNNVGNVIKEQRLKGSFKTWITSEVMPKTIKPTEKLLVIDIVRDILGSRPDWSAIVILDEATYAIALESLVLDE